MDIQLHYTEQGSGFPLILLHGNGEDSTYFEHQIPYFSKQYRVIAIDTRGHGKSPRGTAPFTLIQFAEDLKHFLDEHSITKAHILGFSDGGNIALEFILRYPQYVEKLVVDGANLFPKGVKWRYQAPVVIGYHIANCFAKKSEKALRNAEMLNLMVSMPHIVPKDLERITIPTLVMAGDRDMIRDAHTRLIHEHIKGSQLCILKGSHFCAHECPEAFNTVVEDFLNSYSTVKKHQSQEKNLTY